MDDELDICFAFRKYYLKHTEKISLKMRNNVLMQKLDKSLHGYSRENVSKHENALIFE